jgi:hypothetical protein
MWMTRVNHYGTNGKGAEASCTAARTRSEHLLTNHTTYCIATALSSVTKNRFIISEPFCSLPTPSGSVWLNQFRLIVNESYCGSGVVVREASCIAEGRRTAASHADRCANSDCDRDIVQWPGSEERARVGLGSLEPHSGRTSISATSIKRITAITSPGFRWFLRCWMKLHQLQGLLSQEYNGRMMPLWEI